MALFGVCSLSFASNLQRFFVSFKFMACIRMYSVIYSRVLDEKSRYFDAREMNIVSLATCTVVFCLHGIKTMATFYGNSIEINDKERYSRSSTHYSHRLVCVCVYERVERLSWFKLFTCFIIVYQILWDRH